MGEKSKQRLTVGANLSSDEIKELRQLADKDSRSLSGQVTVWLRDRLRQEAERRGIRLS